ncbi:MAG: hypothetical protein ACOCUT_00710 [bacterium]
MDTIIISAAGGNPTAINFRGSVSREDYPEINNKIQERYPQVEQVGFYEEKDGLPKLQMAGGEFCGNGTRAFACLLKKRNPESSNFVFYVSGYPAKVEAHVDYLGTGKYFCEAFFNSMKTRIEKKKLKGKDIAVVDMGGIIHIIVEEKDFAFEELRFATNMKEIKDELSVDGEAVGVLWVNKEGNAIEMKPVVWVKEIDTCFYETSCGSGSLAIAFANQKSVRVKQPSGKDVTINLQKNGNVVMSSEMEEINGK